MSLDLIPAGVDSLVHSLIFGGGGGAAIKSVQRGTASPANGDSRKDITISAVDPNKAIATISWRTSSDDTSNTWRAWVYDATTLRIDREGSSGAATIEWEVIEFDGANVQTILPSLWATLPVNTTITEVNMDKTFLLTEYQFYSLLSHPGTFMATARLTSSTNVESNRNMSDSNYSTRLAVQIVEVP